MYEIKNMPQIYLKVHSEKPYYFTTRGHKVISQRTQSIKYQHISICDLTKKIPLHIIAHKTH